MNLSEELQKLEQLRASGSINDAEFAAAKAKLLNEQPAASPVAVMPAPVNIEQQTRQWAMFLHLSLLAGFVIPLAGVVLPIILWQVKKNELPGIDAHGKVVVNWIISEIIYFIGGMLLCFIIIGIPILIAVGIVGIVFPIIGAVKANSGQLWKYPLTIPFFK